MKKMTRHYQRSIYICNGAGTGSINSGSLLINLIIELQSMQRMGGDWYWLTRLTHVARKNCRRIAIALASTICLTLQACAATPTSNKPDEVYVKEAWAYFKKKCDTEAGEKIYKTYAGVKSVLVVKPLPPATEKDLYDQFWMGDPYSDATPWNRRGEQQGVRLIGNQRFISGRGEIGLEFFEQEMTTSDGKAFQRVEPSQSPPYFVSKSFIEKPTSRFGVSWEDISTSEDRKFWVAGSRFRVIDLTDNSIVAERIGFLIEAGFGSTARQRRPWLTSRGPGTTCPSLRNGTFEDRWFILNTLNPVAGEKNGK